MPIAVVCGKCEGRFNAPDVAAGRRGKCPKCGESITVQGATDPPPIPAIPHHGTSASIDDLDGDAEDERNRDVDNEDDISEPSPSKLKAGRPTYRQWLSTEMTNLFGVSGDDNEPSSQEPATVPSTGLRPCPDCDNFISRRAAQCPSCGCPLGSIAATADSFSGSLAPSYIGQILTVVGFAGVLFFAFVFDATVSAEVMGRDIQVHNVSLGQARLLGFIFSVGLMIFGRTPSYFTVLKQRT